MKSGIRNMIALALVIAALNSVRAGEPEFLGAIGGTRGRVWRDERRGLTYMIEGLSLLVVKDAAPRPACLSRTRLPPGIEDVVVMNQCVYVVIHAKEIMIIDCRDPSAPKKLKGLDYPINDVSIEARGPFLKVESGYKNPEVVTFYDVSKPDSPEAFHKFSLRRTSPFLFDGKIFYIATWEAFDNGDGVRQWEATSGSESTPRPDIKSGPFRDHDGIYFLGQSGERIDAIKSGEISSRRLIVMRRWTESERDETDSYEIITFSQSDQTGDEKVIEMPSKEESLPWRGIGPVKSICANNSKIYALCGDGVVYEIDGSDPKAPVIGKPLMRIADSPCSFPNLRHSWDTGTFEVRDDGTSLYFKSKAGGEAINLGLELHPVYGISRFLGSLDPPYICVSENEHSRFFDPYGESLIIYKVEPNAHPPTTLFETIDGLSSPQDAALVGDILYIADGEGGLAIYRVPSLNSAAASRDGGKP